MRKSVFKISGMDCPSEEALVRLALNNADDITKLQFDLNERTLTAFHRSEAQKILGKLVPLNLGASYVSDVEISDSMTVDKSGEEKKNNAAESTVLIILLAINAAMFFLEIALGFVAQSTGLIADAVDMFADAAVYGISLYAVGKAVRFQHRAARISGIAQVILATFALFEVFRRFIFGSDPEANYMIVVSLLALLANVLCLILISRHRNGGVHMKASMIFSANDVIANIGVIFAGFLVAKFESPYPDLVIGLIIAFVVFRGATSILRMSKAGDS